MLLTWCTADPEGIDLPARVEAAITAWATVATCEIEHEYRGDCATAGSVGLAVYGGDPDDVLPPGAPAMTTSAGAYTLTLNDTGDYTFATDADVADGTCVDALNLDALLRHEVGHALGLDHTCEEGDPCTDAADRDALMYWATAPCAEGAVTERDVALLCGGGDTGGGDTGDTAFDPWAGGLEPVEEEEDKGGSECGCGTPAPAGWLVVVGAVVAAGWRRRE